MALFGVSDFYPLRAGASDKLPGQVKRHISCIDGLEFFWVRSHGALETARFMCEHGWLGETTAPSTACEVGISKQKIVPYEKHKPITNLYS